MKESVLDADGVEPLHMAVVIGQLSMVVIVAPRMVGLEMPMNCRVRVIRVSFVHVLRGKRRREGDVRHQNQADDETLH